MENMNKGLTVPKWVLIVRPEIPQMPQNLSAQFVCLSPKLLDFNKKRLHWASAVRALTVSRGPNSALTQLTSFQGTRKRNKGEILQTYKVLSHSLHLFSTQLMPMTSERRVLLVVVLTFTILQIYRHRSCFLISKCPFSVFKSPKKPTKFS